MAGRAVNATRQLGVAILGSTGSIGASTLDVLARHRDRFSVFALAAHSNVAKLFAQCVDHRPRYAVLSDLEAAAKLRALMQSQDLPTEVLAGLQALAEIAGHPEVDYVMAAIVGAAGLRPTLAAAQAGKRVLLANKEALVMSGPLFLQAVEQGGAQLIPIDSEHNAIFQCLPQGELRDNCVGRKLVGVRKILLTVSGGLFLRMKVEILHSVTLD